MRKGSVSRALQRFSTRDLVIIAAFAALGIAIKPVVVPLVHLITAPLFIPGGALAGGLYMMWLVIGMGIVRKPGTATLIALIQALLVMFTGVVGSHGAMSLVSYAAPGIVMDLGLLAVRHRACCLMCCTLAGVLANVTGTIAVSAVFFRLPPIPLALAVCTAALSGAVGGVLAYQLIRILRSYRIGVGPGAGAGHGACAGSDARAAHGACAGHGARAGHGACAGHDARAGQGSRAGRLTSSIVAVVLATMLTPLATGCASASSTPTEGVAPSESARGVESEIALIDGTSGWNGSLDVAAVSAAADGQDQVPLNDALRAVGRRLAKRVAVYGADGSIVRASAGACALSGAGGLLVAGEDAGALVGVVLDPPSASVCDVRAIAQESLAAGGRTLVLYLDGFGWDQYVAARDRGDIPHMARLTAARAMTVYPTITPVTFASMVSGEDPATTGVRDRTVHRLSCDTVFGWAEERGMETSLIEGEVQVLDLTRNTLLNPDADGDGTTDDEVFAAAKRRLAQGQPDLMLVHLHGIDDVAADQGPFSAATFARVKAQDAMVGALMRTWKGQVIVVADHGLHAVENGGGERSGEHGDFRSEDLFIPLLVRKS